jgi:hypothetical protein
MTGYMWVLLIAWVLIATVILIAEYRQKRLLSWVTKFYWAEQIKSALLQGFVMTVIAALPLYAITYPIFHDEICVTGKITEIGECERGTCPATLDTGVLVLVGDHLEVGDGHEICKYHPIPTVSQWEE